MLLLSVLCSSCKRESPFLQSSDQIILVQSNGWNAPRGNLVRLQRSVKGWNIIDSTSVVIGRSGMGWGTGIPEIANAFSHPTGQLKMPTAEDKQSGSPNQGIYIKKEGDGRSPAGIFELPFAFGYISDGPHGSKVPYLKMSAESCCVDDTASSSYNLVIREPVPQKIDWQSAETMLRDDNLYSIGVFVGHNSTEARPGEGSCIFLHVWKDAATYTSGCTAMDSAYLATLISWLDSEKRPLLIQMPKSEFEQRKSSWGLKIK